MKSRGEVRVKSPDSDSAGQLQRLLWLDGEIRAGRHPDASDLMDHFEVSRRTAYNTIAYLRDSLGAPIEFDRSRRGYTYSDPTYGLPAVFLREGELLALILAQQVTRQYLGTPLEWVLRQAIEKLSRYLPDGVTADLGEMAAATVLGGGAGLDAPLEYVRCLQQAVRDRRVTAIRYYSPRQDQETEREIEPHFLTNVRGDWMVVAWDQLRGEPRTFMLARMRECRPLKRRFKLRPGLTPEEYAANAFLVEYGQETHDVVLRFDAYLSRWIRERRWHVSQQLTELEGDRVELRLTVSGDGDLFRWILQHGRHVEVISPVELRQRVVEELNGAVELYSTGAP